MIISSLTIGCVSLTSIHKLDFWRIPRDAWSLVCVYCIFLDGKPKEAGKEGEAGTQANHEQFIFEDTLDYWGGDAETVFKF